MPSDQALPEEPLLACLLARSLVTALGSSFIESRRSFAGHSRQQLLLTVVVPLAAM